MNCSYYTNIQDRREAIKEAVTVLLEHDEFEDIKGEKQFLTLCEAEDSEGLYKVIFESCKALTELHVLVAGWPSEELEKRLNEGITKQFGDVETYKEHLIKLSNGDERIQSLLTEKYYRIDNKKLALRGCQWAFEREMDENIDAYQYISAENIEFCLECEKAGVDTNIFDNLFPYNQDEEVINILASLKAYEYLDEQELITYKWVESCLDGEDKVAEIASKHLDKVICNKKDLKWLKEKTKSNVPQAQYLMALLYLPNDLDIVSENKSLAGRYLQAAKDGGCALADAELQKLGPDTATTFEDENTLLAKATEGDKIAMIELGNLYAFEGNDAEAKKWRKKANSKGCTGTNSTAGRGGRKPKTFFQKAMITLKKMF